MSFVNASDNLININSPNNSRATLVFKRKIPDQNWKSTFQLQTLQNQAEKREILAKCISRIRSSTQVKSFHSLTKQQLDVIDDQGSSFSNGKDSKQITQLESRFEKNYYEAKLQIGKLRQLVLKLLEKHSKKSEWTIRPSHPFVIFWNVIKLCFMVHIFLLFPLMDAFGSQLEELLHKQQELFLFEWLFLLFDIVLRFNVSIYKDGQLIKNHNTLAIQYLKSGFIIDSLGFIGFSLFLFQDILYIRYVYFFKISEIKKFIKFLRYEMDPQNKYNNHIKLITLFVTIFFLAHIIACLWIVAGNTDSNNWMKQHNLQDNQWYIIYIWAFYFAILTMTTVGYGDIVPINEKELIACIMIVLLSSAIFAYTLNTITTVLKDIDQEKSQYQQDARIIQNYMIRKGCETDLQRRVQQYLKLMWKWGLNEQNSYEQKIFSRLSASLQQEINLQDKGQMLLKVPFLVNNFSIDCIKELMQYITEVYYQPGEIISTEDGLYLLYKGDAGICWGSKTNPKYICDISQGDNYGLLNLFNIDQSKYFLKSKNFSIFYFIPTSIMIKVLKNIDNETFCMITDQVEGQNLFNLFLTCPLCRREGHHLCQDIIFKPSRSLAIAKINRKHFQEREKHKRSMDKYQILRNFKDIQVETCQFIRDKKEIMDSRYRSIIDSDEIEDEPESLQLQSSQSLIYESGYLDERKTPSKPHDSPIQKQQSVNRSGSIKKATMLAQPNKINIARKNTQDCSINLMKIEPDTELQLQINVDRETQETHDHYYNIDSMKQFSRYFKTHNYENVIKKINSKKRTFKKRLKRFDKL